MSLSALWRAMRPHQWVKNVFVLAALVFRLGELGDPTGHLGLVSKVLLAFFAFCCGASAIYLVNDCLDAETDRTHPTKRTRPIAAGELSIHAALIAAGCLMLAALAFGWGASTASGSVVVIVAGYMALQLLYSLKLKHVVIVDAFVIASGFLLRVVAGGYAAEAPLSHWLVLCTLFLALFLALCKRRAEIDLLGDDRGEHRKILLEYTPEFLDQTVVVLTACAIVSYTMYTVDTETVDKFSHGEALIWTVPFVVFGLFRYLLLVRTQRGGGSPTRVLLGGDGAFLANALAWLAVVALALFL
ncbi:MAG: decaprenyl-phosphate phosphoribosyltransferase [bacterium]|nr:decaprenyl-phosphate phosphoribosyltransferase [bacterium]